MDRLIHARSIIRILIIVPLERRVTYGITSFLGILLLHNHDLRLVYESAPQSYEKKLNSHQFSVVCFTELSEKKVPYKSTNDEERND